MLICGGIYGEGCFRKRHPSFFELEMREKSETNLKITIYFFLFGKVDKLMFAASPAGACGFAIHEIFYVQTYLSLSEI